MTSSVSNEIYCYKPFSFADSDNTAIVSSEIINSFIKGSSSSADIETKLGKPSKIILNSETENWYKFLRQPAETGS